jgi:3-oxoacyl-[acyl-carrier-protein] synthase II
MTHHRQKPRRVVITGIGAVTPAGKTFEGTWKGILSGRSNGRAITLFDASQMPCGVGYEVEDFQPLEDIDTTLATRATHFAVTAAREALAQAKLGAGNDPYRTAVCLGVGVPSTSYAWFSDVFAGQKWDDPSIAKHAKHFPYVLTSLVAAEAKAQGGNTTIHTACASSGQGLGEAFELIQDGSADVVVTGGADSMINPLHIAGFNLLGALAVGYTDPQTASRPFDVKRSGFVMGEGACILIFEELEHAKKRGATIRGEICGYGITESCYRITDLHPEGQGPVEAMTMAIEQAGIAPREIGYLNAHGTSTKLNDAVESLSVCKVFADALDQLKVSSTKSVTGHLISAAGAIELAICAKAIAEGTLPPTANLEVQDPSCTVPLTATTPERRELRYALSNSIGFGGSNTALIVGRYDA